MKTLILCAIAGLLVTGTLWAAGEERFFGGGFDGYSRTSKAGMRISDGIPSGTVLSFR